MKALTAAMILQRTPDDLTPAMAKALEAVGTRPPMFLSIIECPPTFKARMCFNNVANLIRTAGGKIVLGWQVHEGGGGRYLKLHQHAVYEVGENSKFPSEPGTRLDPTPPVSAYGLLDTDTLTLFVQDDTMTFPKSGGILSAIYIQLDDSPETADAIIQMRALDAAHKSGSGLPVTRGRIGRNEHCPCGSGVKFKRCHG